MYLSTAPGLPASHSTPFRSPQHYRHIAQLLREVLAFHEGNQSRAATALGINRATLRKKLAAHGLI